MSRKRSGCAGGAELLPGEPLERRRELREMPRALRERPQDEQEEDRRSRRRRRRGCGCRSRARRRRRRAARRGSRCPETIASAERDHEQDQHVGVAQRAAARDRVAGDQRRRAISPAARIAVSSGGNRPATISTRAILYPRAVMRVLILGGDGYLGWPTAMRFSDARPRGFGRRQLLPAPLAHRELDRFADPDRLAGRSDRGLARGLGQRDPAVRGLDRGLRLPRRGDRRDPARGDRPLRRAALGAVLDEVARDRGRDPVHERDRQPQPAVRDPRPRARLPPGQARDDGRVRDPEHRHRGGVHRDRAQGTQGHAAVPEAARARSTTSRRSTTRTTSTSPAGSGACAPPTSTRASSTGSRPTRPPATSASSPASTTTSTSARCSTASACRR